LNGYPHDIERLPENKKQQKTKKEMTCNELEMFLNDSESDKTLEDYSQKIDSDYDTLFYYASGL